MERRHRAENDPFGVLLDACGMGKRGAASADGARVSRSALVDARRGGLSVPGARRATRVAPRYRPALRREEINNLADLRLLGVDDLRRVGLSGDDAVRMKNFVQAINADTTKRSPAP